MPKRSAETQITKDGQADEEQPSSLSTSTMATNSQMAGRKIAAAKGRKGRIPGSIGPRPNAGSNIPNFFSNIGGDGGANGTTTPGGSFTGSSFGAPSGGFGGNAQAPAQSVGFGGNTAGSFGNGQSASFTFGQTATSNQTNGNNMFGGGGGGSFGSAAPSGGSIFGNVAPPPPPPPSSAGFQFNIPKDPAKGMEVDNGGSGSGGNPFAFGAPEAPKSFTFGASAQQAPTPPVSFNFGAQPATTSAPMFGSATTATTSAPPAFGGFGSGTATAPATNGFSFGQQPAQNSGSNLFGNNKPAEAPKSSGFTFGAKPAEPASTHSSFGENQPAAAAAPPTLFGNAPANNDKPAEAPKTSGLFGDNKPATTNTGSSIFGNNDNKPAAAPTSNLFGAKPAESSAPASNLFGAKPAESSAPASNLFGAKPAESSAPASGLFGTKPAAQPASSLFSNPPPATGLFGAPATTQSEEAKPATSGLFGSKPAESAAPAPAPFAGFGAPAKTEDKEAEKSEPQKSIFDTKKTETTSAAPLFGGATTAAATDKPLFGAPAATASQPPAAFAGFKPAATTTPFSGFGQPAKPAEEKQPEEKSAAPAAAFGFSKPAEDKPAAPAPAFGFSKPAEKPAEDDKPAPAPAFGFNKPAEKPADKPDFAKTNAFLSSEGFSAPKAAAPSAFAPAPTNAFGAPKAPEPSSPTRKKSPPLPPNHHEWSSAQMTEYYNLFAQRSLNHFFKEAIGKADALADLSQLCEAYLAESAKIRDLQKSNQKYNFGSSSSAAPSANTVTGKRMGDETLERGSKRQQMEKDDPKKSAFSPGKSATSQTLGSILGGAKKDADKPTLADKPAFGFKPPTSDKPADTGLKLAAKPAFGFAPPSASTTTTDKPTLADKPAFGFKPPTSDKPADSGLKLAAKPSFGFKPPGAADQPAADKPAAAPKSVFEASKPTPNEWSSIFPKQDASTIPDDKSDSGDNDKPAAASGGLFGRINMPPPQENAPENPPAKSIFDSATTSSSSSSGLFGNAKPANSIFAKPPPAPAAAAPAAPANADSSEPSDDVPQAPTLTLSAQGPGEEDEESLFEARTVVYVTTAEGAKKSGVGQFRVLYNAKRGKSRVVVRTDGGKVIMNVGLVKSAEYKQKGTENVLLVKDFADEKLYMVKVGKGVGIEGLIRAVNEAKDRGE